MKFDEAFNFVVGQEGGYVNHPKDPGGETKFGICKRDYPHLDIKNLTLDQAKEIYQKNYWEKAGCNHIPESVRLAVFDCAVNQGVVTAIKLLQDTVGVTSDGILGPMTIGAASSYSREDLLVHFLAERMLRYTKTRNFDTFGRGWTRRLFHLATEGK